MKRRKIRRLDRLFCFGRFGRVDLAWRASDDVTDGKAPFELRDLGDEWILRWKGLQIFVIPGPGRDEDDHPSWGIA